MDNVALKHNFQDQILFHEEEVTVVFPDGYVCSVLNFNSIELEVVSRKSILNKEDSVEIFGHKKSIGKFEIKNIRSISNERYLLSLEHPIENFLEVCAVIRTQTLLARHTKENRLQQVVPPRFRQMMLQLLDNLQSLCSHSVSLNELFLMENSEKTLEAEQRSVEELASFLKGFLEPTLNAMAESIRGVSGNIQKESLEYFRLKLKQIIFQGYEPELYAKNMNQYNRSAHIFFSKVIQRYFEMKPRVELKEQKMDLLVKYFYRQFIKGPKTEGRFLFVGADVVCELLDLIDGRDELCRKEFHFVFVENNDFYQKKLEKKIHTFNQLNSTNYSYEFVSCDFIDCVGVENIEGQFDFIYVSTFVSNLTKDILKDRAKLLCKKLTDRGDLIFSCLTVSEPTRLTMNMALSWNLSFRTNDDYRAIFGDVGERFRLERSGRNTSLHCILKK